MLSALIQKLLHVRNWTIGDNSSKEAKTVMAHTALLICSLSLPIDPLISNLQTRLVLKVLELVSSPGGHPLYLGNWNKDKLKPSLPSFSPLTTLLKALLKQY